MGREIALPARIARVVSLAPSSPDILYAAGAGPLVAGRGSHVEQMLALAGGENVAADSDKPYPTYSVERVLARAPEVVVIGSHSTKEDPAARLSAALPGLDAARRHRVYELDGNLL